MIGLSVIDLLNALIGQVVIQLSVQPTSTDVCQKLCNCISGLANHIYYTDQIRDICTVIIDWSRTFFSALVPASGKTSPSFEYEDVTLDVKLSAIWSLRILRDVLIPGTGSVGLEEVWMGTEGGLGGRECMVRIEYVSTLVTHLRSIGKDEEEEDVHSIQRFLTMIHVPIYNTLKLENAVAIDYWAIWVLLLALWERFNVKEVVKALPMMWQLQDSVVNELTPERRACVEGIALGLLSILSESFDLPNLKSAVNKVLGLDDD